MMRSINERMLAIRGFSDLRYAKLPFAPIQVPIIDWIQIYTKEDLKYDFLAGIIMSVLLIPQGIAYAVLTGVPPVYGLYACTIPLFIYALLGTSRQLSMGPASITSLLLASGIQQLGYETGDGDYLMAVLNMSMLSGLILYFLGALRLGVLANFLSHSVLTGFITAAALLVMLGQFKYILDIQVPNLPHTHNTIIYILSHIHESNGYAMLLGVSGWVALYMVKIWKKHNKSTPEKAKSRVYRILALCANLSNLIAVFFGSIFAYAIISNHHHIQIIGYVKPGFAAPAFAFFEFDAVLEMLPGAAIVGLVSFAISWAPAKKFASLNGYEVDATQELIAMGLTNILGPLFNSFAIASSLSRSAVMLESGGRTQITGCISAVIVIIALQMTFMFFYIPLPIVAAIIEVSASSLLDFDEMVKAYHIDRKDCAVMVVTFLTTFFIGIAEGVMMGIVLSIVFVMNATAFPRIAHLGQLPVSEGGYFKDVNRYEHAKQLPGISIISMDTSLYFANSAYFKGVVRSASLGTFHTSCKPIVFIIIDVSAWHDVDLSGINVLVELHEELLAKNIVLGFASARGQLRYRLKKAKFIEKLGEQYMYNNIEDAVRHLPVRRQSIDIEMEAVETNYGTESRHSIASYMSTKTNDSFDINGRNLSQSLTGQAMFTSAYYSLDRDDLPWEEPNDESVMNPLQFIPSLFQPPHPPTLPCNPPDPSASAPVLVLKVPDVDNPNDDASRSYE